MSVSRLPSAVERLVRAVNAGDVEAAFAAFQPDASIVVDGNEHGTDPARRWAKELASKGTPELRILYQGRRGGDLALAAQLHWSATDIEGPFLCLIQCPGDAIRRLEIVPVPAADLPDAVREFVTAVNRRDPRSLLDVFAADALVNDELVEYRGARRIAEWVQRAVIDRKLALYVVGHDAHDDRVVVTSHATGDFDMQGLPDPLVLSLYFSLHDERIVQIIILQNQAAD